VLSRQFDRDPDFGFEHPYLSTNPGYEIFAQRFAAIAAV
jgi:hypothetical protein